MHGNEAKEGDTMFMTIEELETLMDDAQCNNDDDDLVTRNDDASRLKIQDDECFFGNNLA